MFCGQDGPEFRAAVNDVELFRRSRVNGFDPDVKGHAGGVHTVDVPLRVVGGEHEIFPFGCGSVHAGVA